MAVLGFRNAARRDTVSAAVRARLAADVPWGVATVDVVDRVVTADGAVTDAMVVEVRFRTPGEADAFVTDVLAQLGSGVNGPVAGSVLSRHDCRHDEGAACEAPVIVGSW